MSRLTLLLLRFTLPRPRDERGDVPGWVMVVVTITLERQTPTREEEEAANVR